MIGCKRCLKDESHQSVSVWCSIPRTFLFPPDPQSLDLKHVPRDEKFIPSAFLLPRESLRHVRRWRYPHEILAGLCVVL